MSPCDGWGTFMGQRTSSVLKEQTQRAESQSEEQWGRSRETGRCRGPWGRKPTTEEKVRPGAYFLPLCLLPNPFLVRLSLHGVNEWTHE